tara:strand:- start:923 stop:1144 length:222 start_codon:yes stop_codon:yes gene_type:complete
MACNVTIKPRAGESAERMIKRFMKKVKKQRIIEQVRDRRYYKKKSDVQRLTKQKAIRDAQKKLAKKRALEKNI